MGGINCNNKEKPVKKPSAPERTISARIRCSIKGGSEKRNIARLNSYLLNEKIAGINDALPVS